MSDTDMGQSRIVLTAAERIRADIAEAAAMRIGGGDRDVLRLLFEVECAIGRQGRRAA